MTKKYNFVTHSTFGDVIWSLCAIKHIGGGNLYVKLHALDAFHQKALGWKDTGVHAGRLTVQDYEFMAPLLKAQDYLDQVDIWTNQNDDFPILLDHFKFHRGERWQGNQTECYALSMGWDIYDPKMHRICNYEPWLTAVDPILIPGKYIAVHRADRYNYNGPPSVEWQDYINKGLSEVGFFLGTDLEHAAFEQKFGIRIHHQKVTDLLDMAKYIQGAELFIGNQSVHAALAIGLGKSYGLEIRKDYEQTVTRHGFGDNWFPRINGYYF